MARIVDLGVTQYLWVPTLAGIANPLLPTDDELTAVGVKNISQFVVTTTDINPDDSDTITEKGITDTSNAVVPTIGNYHGTLNLFRDFTAGIPTASVDLAATFTKGAVGWIVRRLGKPATTAIATADLVDLFLFLVDKVAKTGGQGDGYLKLNCTLLQQGQYHPDIAVVAGTTTQNL
jgi:hypothetical protein